MDAKRHGIMFFTTILDYQRGNLSFMELPQDIGFEIKRIFWVSGNRDAEWRAGHKHKICKQVLICLYGGITVEADDTRYRLDDSEKGLFIDAGVTISYKMDSISTVLLVLASEHYDAEEYINDYKPSRS